MESTAKYYVYEHWRPDEGVIFYVGKGQKRRAWDTHRGRSDWHKFIVAKLKRMGMLHEVRIIEYFADEYAALAREREMIERWRALGADLVNLTDGGEGPTGLKHTEEWKRANSARMKGRRPSAETRAKMSAAAMGNKKGLGKKKPLHAVEALAAYWRGRPKSPETRRKISESKRGQIRLHSAEEDVRASERQKGIPKSDETRRRMSLHRKSDAHKQKLRDINLGRTHSEETRKRLSEIAKADWARRRVQKSMECRE